MSPPSFGHYSNTPVFNTKAVVRETEVPADTFRAWERRYGIPLPQRNVGGHRLYSERDIAIIRWLRDRTGEGMSISHAVTLLMSSLEDQAQPMDTGPRDTQRLTDDFIAALLQFDAVEADRLLSEAFALYQFETVLLNLVQPAMVEIGDRWDHSEISVAAEHFATQFVRRKLSSLLSLFESETRRGKILIACPPGEQHDLGSLFATLFMVRRGWQVIFLGAQVPLQDLLEAIRIVSPDLVCLSASMQETATQLAEAIRAIQVAYPQVRVGYGGRVFNLHQELRGVTPGIFLGHNARDLVESIEMVLGRTRSIPGP